MASLQQELSARSVAGAQIHKEAFGPAETATGSERGLAGARASTVSFTKAGLQVRWTPSDGSLLDLALKNGVEAPHLCRVGDCQSCLHRLQDGAVVYPPDLEAEPPDGYVLLPEPDAGRQPRRVPFGVQVGEMKPDTTGDALPKPRPHTSVRPSTAETGAISFDPGNYHFLPNVFQYSAGGIAAEGHRIIRCSCPLRCRWRRASP